MISYDNYKNRIEKLAKAKRTAHKFRFLIMGAVALVLGTSVGLMVAKGAHMSDTLISAQSVEFNQPYEVTPAKAFLDSVSSQSVEYSVEGSDEWSTEKPVKAGKYLARTVSPKLVGYSYSNPVAFEITPIAADFNIIGDAMVYGDVPECNVTNLVAGHKLEKQSLEFNYGSYGSSTTEVSAVRSTLKITDAKGEDYTSCYDVTINSKVLTVTERSIEVRLADGKFVYDGTAKTVGEELSEGTAKRLAAGDKLTVTAEITNNGMRVSAPTDAGTYSVRPVGITVTHGDTDVTARYSASFVNSLLSIAKRELTVRAENAEKTYDGRPLSCDKYTSENLVDGHRTEVDGSSVREITGAGSVSNDLAVVIYDGNGKDVTENYQQSCVAGTLTVNRFTATVTTADGNKIYDGAPLYNFEDYTLNKRPDNAAITFAADEDSVGSRGSDVGFYDNAFDVKAYLNGEDVSENFDLDYDYGTLRIDKRQITVKTKDGEKVFDGEPLSVDGYEQLTNIVPEHELTVAKSFERLNATGAAGVDNAVVYDVLDADGKSVGGNYDIKYTYGKLVVNKLQIAVTTATDSREYDGTTLTNTGYTIEKLNGNDVGYVGSELYNGDTLTPTRFTGLITVDSKPNECAYALPTYDEANSNYEIIGDITYGTLTVTPKAVTVTINPVTAVYGEAISYYGEELPAAGFTLDTEDGKLPNNETLTFKTQYIGGGLVVTPAEWNGYYLLDAGDYTIALTPNTQKITGGNADLNNYDFDFVRGTLTIERRIIYYKTASEDKIYDGLPLENVKYETFLASDSKKAGLLNGDELKVLNNPTSIVEAQERRNANYYSLPNDNYQIDLPTSEANFGTLIITPRYIFVTTADDSKPYDGTPLENTNYTVQYAVFDVDALKWVADATQQGLVSQIIDGVPVRDTLTLKGTAFSITDVGEGTNVNAFENPNYRIRGYNYGTLKITKCEINVELGEWPEFRYGEFDKDELTTGTFFKDGAFTNDVLLNGEQLFVTFKFKQGDDFVTFKNVGEYVTVADSFTVRDADGNVIENGTKNYEITCVNGKHKIVAREVEVTIQDKTAVYGDDLTANSVKYVAQNLSGNGVSEVEALSFGETIVPDYVYDREINGVGNYDITATTGTVYDKDGKPVENGCDNYAITYVGGTLTVGERSIKIKTSDGSKTYDGKPLEKPTPIITSVSESGASRTPLAAGDKWELVSSTSITDATETDEGNNPVPNENVYKIVNAKGDDVTANYDIEYEYGELSILRKSASLYMYNDLHSERIVYGTGDKWSYPTGKHNYRSALYMVEGEEIELAVEVHFNNEKVDAPKDVGHYYVLPDWEKTIFYRADGTVNPNGYANYKFSPLLYGKLEVIQKAITVTIDDRTLSYGDFDETEVYTYDYAITDGLDENGKLPYEETLTVENFIYKKNAEEVTPKNVGKYAIEGGEVLVNGAEEGARNYSVLYEGTLTINKKVLDIEFFNRGGIGSEYGTCRSGYFTERGNKSFITVSDGQKLELPYGEDLSVIYRVNGVGEDEIPPVTAGGYLLTASSFVIRNGSYGDKLDEGETLENYEITCADLHMSVYEREIALTVKEVEPIEYGAEIPTSYEYDFDEEYSYLTVFFEQLGERLEYEFGYEEEEVKNVGTYHVVVKCIKVYDKDGNLKPDGDKNYKVISCTGTLEIIKKPITIQLENKAIKYGDRIPTVSDFNLIEDGESVHNGTLAHGETLTVSVIYYEGDASFTPKNIGKYSVVAVSYAICDENGNEIDSGTSEDLLNYDITCTDGELTIEPRPITVVLKPYGESKVDYGNTFAYADGRGNYAGISNLAYGEDMQVAVKYSEDKGFGEIVDLNGNLPKNAGLYVANIDDEACVYYELKDGVWTAIEDGYKNYIIEKCDPIDSLRIDRLTIDITALSFTGENALTYGDYTVEKSYPSEAGNYEAVTKLPYGEDISITVKITLGGYLEITDRKYLPAYDTAYVVEIQREFTVYADGEDPVTGYGRTRNYKLGELTNGSLEVNRRTITVTPSDLDPVYYGEIDVAYIDNFYPPKAGNYANEPDLAEGETLRIKVYYSRDGIDGVLPREVGTYKIKVDVDDFIIYDENGDEDELGPLWNYKLVAGGDGELEIKQRPVSVSFADKNCKYGEDIPATNPVIIDLVTDKVLEAPFYGDEIKFALVYTGRGNGGTHYEASSALASVGDGTVLPSSPKAVDTYDFEAYAWSENGRYDNYDYDINFDGSATLEIEPMAITIVLKPVADFTYDGLEHPYGDGFDNYLNAETLELAYGEKLEVVVKYLRNGEEVSVPKDAGSYKIVLDNDNCVFTDEDGYPTLGGAGNYDITCEPVEFTISKAKVSGTVNDIECFYGTDTKKLDYSLTATVDGTEDTFYKTITLLNGETADVVYELKSLVNDATVNAVNVGEYGIRASVEESFRVNYDFTFERGKLTIKKLALDINLNDRSFEYGVATPSRVGNDSDSKLPYKSHRLSFDINYVDEDGNAYPAGSFLDKGDYKAVAVECTLTVSDGDPETAELVEQHEDGTVLFSTESYDIVCHPSDVEITPKSIKIISHLKDGETVVYGDKYEDVLKKLDYHVYDSLDVNIDLPNDDSFELEYSYDPELKNAGRYEEVIHGVVKAVYRNGELVANGLGNYEIEYEAGELIIEEKSITLQLTETECFYGEVPDYESEEFFTFVGSGMVYGEVLKPAFVFTGVSGVTTWNAGSYRVTLNVNGTAVETADGGAGLVDNYSINFARTTYTIKRLPVNVVIGNDGYTYGERTPSVATVYDELPNGEEFDFTYKFIKDEKTTENPVAAGVYVIDAEIEMKNGVGLVSNYDLETEGSVVKGELTISPKKITVQLNATVKSFAYGEDYGAVLGKLEIPDGALAYEQDIVASIRYYSVEETAMARMARRAFSLRAGEITPKNVGWYRAELVFEDCKLLNSDGTAAEGGIANYALADGFTADAVTFEITKLKVWLTVDNASCFYGDDLPADDDIDYTPGADIPEGETLKVSFKFGADGEEVKNAKKYAISLADYEIEGGDESNYDVKIINSPELEIEAREITVFVEDQDFAYGSTAERYPTGSGNYDEPAPDLKYGDELEIFVEFYVYNEETEIIGAKVENPSAAGVYFIKYVGFKAVASDGTTDVTANYSVIDAVDGWLNISSLVVKIKTGSKYKVYDGTPLVYDEDDYAKDGFDIVEGEDNLLTGHHVEVDVLDDYTDATDAKGEKNKTTFIIVDEHGVDVSDNYIIKYEYGYYTIDKKSLTITTDSATRDYNGSALVAEFDETTLELGEGDSFVASDFNEITDVGSCPASFTYKIMRDGKDVTEKNYDITENFGTLTVTALAIEIEFNNINGLQYGVQPESLYELSNDLPEDEELTFNIKYTRISGDRQVTLRSDSELILDVGTYRIEAVADSYSVEGGKVTNYSFTYTTGYVTIVKRNIIVVTTTDEREYNGETYFDYNYDTLWADDEEVEGLIGGETLSVISYAEITDVGSIDNDCEYEDLANYDITVRPGTLTVTKRKITVQTGSLLNEVYDGEEHYTEAYEITSDNKLVLDHDLQVKDGTLRKVIDATGVNGVDNDTQFIVVDGDGKSVNGNYDISYDSDCGKIVVHPRAITVKTGSLLNETYDGKEHYTEENEITSDNKLVLDHDLQVKDGTLRKVVNATDENGVDNDTQFIVVDGNGKSVNGNYDISYDTDCGKIVVKPAELTITLNAGVTDIYGDGKYYGALVKDADVGLVNGETIELVLKYYDKDGNELAYAPVNSGDYSASVDWDNCVITRKDGSLSSLDNYDCTITTARTDFTIEKREITVTLNDGQSAEYGEEDYEELIVDGAVEGAVEGEIIELALNYYKDGELLGEAPVNAGTYSVELDWSRSTADGADVSANYELVGACEPVTFTIEQRTLTFKMKDLEFDYGTPVEYGDGVGNYDNDVEVEGLKEGEYLEVLFGYERNGETVETPVYAGEYEIVCTGILIHGEDDAVIAGGADNYDYSDYTRGTLVINGVVVVVTRKDVEKIYDGAPLSVSGKYGAEVGEDEVSVRYVDADGEHTELPAGYKLVRVTDCATDSADVNYESPLDNTAEYEVQYYDGSAGGYISSGKFIVDYDYENNGSLIIRPRHVKIVTKGDKKEYDGTELTAGYDIAVDSEYGLVANHELVIVSRAGVTDVTATPVPNDMDFAVEDAEGNDYTANYDIEVVVGGDLEIYARTISVTLNDVSVPYGETIDLNGYVTAGSLVSDTDSFEFEWFVSKDGETELEISYDEDGYTLLAVGTDYKIVVKENSVTLEEDDVSNYEFVFTVANLTITQREIVVVTDYHEKEYDGTALTGGGYETYFADDDTVKGLIGGDELNITGGYVSITNVSESGTDNSFSFTVSDNYKVVDTICQELAITPRQITVKTGSLLDEEYDGTDHYTVAYEITSENKLVLDHELAADPDNTCKVKDATDENGVDNDTQFIVVDGAGNSVNDNYEIAYDSDCGVIVVNPAELEINLNAGGVVSFQYGTDVAAQIENVAHSALVAGETLGSFTVVYKTEDGVETTPVNVGKYVAKLDVDSVTVIVGGEEIAASNYVITPASESFEIKPKTVVLTLGTLGNKTYDGTEYEYDMDKCVLTAGYSFAGSETLVTAEVVYIDKDGNTVDYPVDAGNYVISLDANKSLMSNGEALSTNYNVTCPDAYLTIDPAKITISLSDVDHVYDGKPYDFTKATEGFEVDGLVGTDEIARTVTYSTENPTTVGTYQIYFDLEDVMFVSGKATNYDWTENNAVITTDLKIKSREIIVTVSDRIAEKGNEEYGVEHIESIAINADGEGFVESDLASAGADFHTTFVEDVAGGKKYTVTVTFTNATVMKNYELAEENCNSGTLIVTDRWIEVTPTVTGTFTYGEAIGKEPFGIEHKHLPDREEDGFVKEGEVEALDLVFTLTNIETGDQFTPETVVDAGTYLVTVQVNGADNYYIQYSDTAVFMTISRRTVKVEIAQNGGDTTFGYENSKPDYRATLQDVSDYENEEGFVTGAMPSYDFILTKNNAEVTRYNAGTYKVGAKFEGGENYDIVVVGTFEVTITKRVIVVAPDPENTTFDYDGNAVSLGESEFKYLYGSAAFGDTVKVVSNKLEPTKLTETITISSVSVVDENGNPVAANYEIHYTRNTAYKVIDCNVNDFKVVFAFNKMKLKYEQTVDGESYPYTGNRITHKIEVPFEEAVSITSGKFATHTVSFRTTSVTVAAAAGSTYDWMNGILKITDANGKDVTNLYDIECTNGKTEAKAIVVTKLKIDVAVTGNIADGLAAGVTKLSATVKAYEEGVGAEVYAIFVRGKKFIGVTVFKEVSGTKADMSDNYEVNMTNNTDISEVEVLTLKEVETLAKPTLDIGFKTSITADDLNDRESSMYTVDENGNRWIKAEYYEAVGLDAINHKVGVLVSYDDGAWVLGVIIYSESGGVRRDASGEYNRGELTSFEGVSVRYMTVDESSKAKRLLYIDFSEAFNDDNSVKEGLVSDGKLTGGYSCEGLATGHEVEVYIEEVNGKYVISVSVFERKVLAGRENKVERYTLYSLVSNAPDGALESATLIPKKA